MKRVVSMAVVAALQSVAGAAPRTFEIAPAKTTWKRGEVVSVTMTYRNTKAKPVTITTYRCAFHMHFAVYDRELERDEPACEKDGAATHELMPNETKIWRLGVFARKTARPGKHTLQITFVPNGAPAALPSNPIEITVEP